jgi:hypothetical protein
MANGTYNNPRAGSNSSKNRMEKLTNKVNGNGDGDNKFYSERVSKSKKKGIHKIGKFKKVFETGDVIYKTKEKKLSTDTDSGKFYVTKSKTHLTKPAPGVRTPFIEKTVKEKTKLVNEKKAGKIDARMHKKNLKKYGTGLRSRS